MPSNRLQRLAAEMLESGIRLEQAVRELERQYIVVALERTGGNRSRAAQSLGLHRNTLNHKMRSHKING